jgi:hypothetical protein
MFIGFSRSWPAPCNGLDTQVERYHDRNRFRRLDDQHRQRPDEKERRGKSGYKNELRGLFSFHLFLPLRASKSDAGRTADHTPSHIRWRRLSSDARRCDVRPAGIRNRNRIVRLPAHDSPAALDLLAQVIPVI